MPGSRDDAYGYGSDEVEWFERFTLRPVDPDDIAVSLEAGAALETVDVPSFLERKLVPMVDTGAGLYRLIQLFGLPNVPGLEAGGGALERERDRTTWQYLFRVAYDPGPEDEDVPETFLLSVYDYKTDISCGLSGWREEGGGAVREPVADPGEAAAVSMPDPEFLVGLAQLVLNLIEDPVPATYEGLWT